MKKSHPRMIDLVRNHFTRAMTRIPCVLKLCKRKFGSVNHQASINNSFGTPLHPDAYLLARQRVCEVDIQKAVVVLESGHERWKGSRPI